MADSGPYQQYIGDDWPFLVSVTDGSGNPFNLTGYTPGGEFWQAYSLTPTDMTIGNGRVSGFGTPANGQFMLTVEKAITETVSSQTGPGNSPTRIQAYVLDQNGLKSTVGIILITPLDVRSI